MGRWVYDVLDLQAAFKNPAGKDSPKNVRGKMISRLMAQDRGIC